MSTTPWVPEVALDLDGAAALVRAAWPELAAHEVVEVGLGWDNLALGLRLGGETVGVVRIARRAVARELLHNEARWLPALAAALPLPVSAPQGLVTLPERYPFPLARYPWLPGRPASDGPWSAEARAAAAPVLGRFLRALHDLPVSEAALAEAPRDDIERMDLAGRMERCADRRAELAGWRPDLPLDAVFERLAHLARAPAHPGPPRWCHGDLYARHLLLDEAGAPCGVIDWGDLHLGDPAVDLSAAYGLLPPVARPAFWAAYGAVDPATRDRARGRSLYSSFYVLHYGQAVGDDHLVEAGEIGLAHALDPAP